MREDQREFIRFAIECGVLRFGEFTLKSGRISPYFFNAGLFDTGARLGRLGGHYAAALEHAGIAYDMLFGPAYKGIPLVAATAIALARGHGRDVPFAFNRKEAKHHGEGGVVVGAPLAGRVVIVDDVVSAGTSVRESVAIIRGLGAEPAGVLIALDRQERGVGPRSAVAEVEERFGIPVVSIVTLDHLEAYLTEEGAEEQVAAIRAYRARYGARER